MKDKIFGVLQRVGRSFMLPIALLPVAGLLLGIGSSFTNETMLAAYGLNSVIHPGTLIYTILDVMSQTGSAVFNNLALLFAMGVAIGMAIIARAAAKRGICTDDTCAQILALLRQYGLPTETAFTRDALTDAARSDKKIADGKLHLIVPERIGRCRIETIPAVDIPAWLADGGIA